MKKLFILGILGMVLTTTPVYASTLGNIDQTYTDSNNQAVDSSTTTNENIPVYINGTLQKFDQPAFMENGRVLVPIGNIARAIGIEVDWNSSENRAIFFQNGVGTVVNLKIDSNIANIASPSPQDVKIGSFRVGQGHNETMDVAPKIINGRTMVPIRYIAEWFGYKVEWKNNSVYVTTK